MASMVPMSAGEMADALMAAAVERAAGRGRRILDQNMQTLAEMARSGAMSLLSDAADPSPQAIDRAFEDFRRLVDLAADAAEELASEGYPADVLGERTLGLAMIRFCPCPPFCR